MNKKTKLVFGKGNAKLEKTTATFSLPAGHTCPAANLCKSMVNRITGKITDGPNIQFRCFAAAAENMFPNVRNGRWNNYDKLAACRTVASMADLIQRSIPRKSKMVRIHASGDFFSQDYFDAWLTVARAMPDLIFYAYTKMLPLWIRRKNVMPSNFRLVASKGVKYDNLIVPNKMRCAHVVFSEADAKAAGLPIDHDDSHCWNYDGDFALLLHGTQPAGSLAGKQVYSMRKNGVNNGYKAGYFDHYKK
jgi:hypothetical protein